MVVCGGVLVVCCVMLFLSCVCVCDLFLFLHLCQAWFIPTTTIALLPELLMLVRQHDPPTTPTNTYLHQTLFPGLVLELCLSNYARAPARAQVNDYPIDTNTRQATTPAALSSSFFVSVIQPSFHTCGRRGSFLQPRSRFFRSF